jgi:hypothetical protein
MSDSIFKAYKLKYDGRWLEELVSNKQMHKSSNKTMIVLVQPNSTTGQEDKCLQPGHTCFDLWDSIAIPAYGWSIDDTDTVMLNTTVPLNCYFCNLLLLRSKLVVTDLYSYEVVLISEE